MVIGAKNAAKATPQIQREFFDQLGIHLGLRRREHWYNVNKKQIISFGGAHILGLYRGSISTALSTIYPEYDWKPWKFPHVPSGFWSSLDHQRDFFDSLFKELRLKSMEEWYNVTEEDVGDGTNLLATQYKGSISRALSTIYPDYPWRFWKFSRTPVGFWQSPRNQATFLQQLGEEMHIRHLDDWYQVTHQDLKGAAHGRGEFVQKFERFQKLLEQHYPQHDWKMWRFATVPDGFWLSLENQRSFVDDYAREIGLSSFEEWYYISRTSLPTAPMPNVPAAVEPRHYLISMANKLGSMIDSYYGGSLVAALASIYPDRPLKSWRFVQPPMGTFRDPINQREFFDYAGKLLGVKTWEDWYNIRTAAVWSLSAAVIEIHGGSLIEALKSVYPELPWRPWNFVKLPRHYWDTEDNAKEFLRIFAEENAVKEPDDWYRVGVAQLIHQGGEGLLIREGGLFALLSKYYPGHPWNASAFNFARKNQTLMVKHIEDVFRDRQVDIHQNFYPPNMVYAQSKMSMELDVYIPSLRLAFEFQGRQHYGQEYLHVISAIEKDKEKREACLREDITLIEIPYWWDCTKSSLLATIHQNRPDLAVDVPHNAKPIPDAIFLQRRRRRADPREEKDSEPLDDDDVANQALDKKRAYSLSLGSMGRANRCRGCQRMLDPSELRVKCEQRFRGQKLAAHFCVLRSCIETGIRTESGSTFPSFAGQVFVPHDLEIRFNDSRNMFVDSKLVWIDDKIT